MNYWPSKATKRRHVSIMDAILLHPDPENESVYCNNINNNIDKNSSCASIIDKGTPSMSRKSYSTYKGGLQFQDKTSQRITESHISNTHSRKDYHSKSPSIANVTKSKSPMNQGKYRNEFAMKKYGQPNNGGMIMTASYNSYNNEHNLNKRF